MPSYENHDFGGSVHRILRGSVSAVLIHSPASRMDPRRLRLSVHRGLAALSLEVTRHYDPESTARSSEISFSRTTVRSRARYLKALRSHG